jgi:hypothetical protein
MTREPIYSALFTLLQNSAPFVTASRRLRHWSDVPQNAQPALFMAQRDESATTQTNQPTVWTLHVDVYLYAHSNDPSRSAAPALNGLLDAVVTALGGPADNRQTLGGLVHYCRVDGKIMTDEGWLGEQSIAVVPIQIKVSTT